MMAARVFAQAQRGETDLFDPAELDARRVALFAGLTGCDLASLFAHAHRRRIGRGGLFFREHDPAGTCHLLLRGRLKLVKANADGAQMIARFVGPGEIFGWAPLLGGDIYPASAEAVVDSASLFWEADAVRQALLDCPRLAVNALELLGGRLRDAERRLQELASEKVERRLARTLLRLVAQSGRQTTGGVEIAFPISRQDLAEATGATLHTMSRILAAWEQQGLVGGARQRVLVRDVSRLEAIADES